jgi:hypothetical protein
VKTILEAFSIEGKPLFQADNLLIELGKRQIELLVKDKVLRPAEELREIDCIQCGEVHGISDLQGQRYYICPKTGYHEIQAESVMRYSSSLYDLSSSLEAALQIDAQPIVLAEDKLFYIGSKEHSGLHTAFFVYRNGDVSSAISELQELGQFSDAVCVICIGKSKLAHKLFNSTKPIADIELMEAVLLDADGDEVWDSQAIFDRLARQTSSVSFHQDGRIVHRGITMAHLTPGTLVYYFIELLSQKAPEVVLDPDIEEYVRHHAGSTEETGDSAKFGANRKQELKREMLKEGGYDVDTILKRHRSRTGPGGYYLVH